MKINTLSIPKFQAQTPSPSSRDAAVTRALDSLASADQAHRVGLFGAMAIHQRCAARALIEGYLGADIEPGDRA